MILNLTNMFTHYANHPAAPAKVSPKRNVTNFENYHAPMLAVLNTWKSTPEISRALGLSPTVAYKRLKTLLERDMVERISDGNGSGHVAMWKRKD